MPETYGFAKSAEKICLEHDVKGCVLLTLHHNGNVGMMAHGVNHYKINEMLSLGIHINLSQHDQAVLDGQAGKAAQDNAIKLLGGEA